MDYDLFLSCIKERSKKGDKQLELINILINRLMIPVRRSVLINEMLLPGCPWFEIANSQHSQNLWISEELIPEK